ncbi:MAG: hypothetical protein LBJ09_00175 [Clostridiales bacterium]|jgi:hypothetical protein|nr:hypothetical protein [Clostridiales bacterium]
MNRSPLESKTIKSSIDVFLKQKNEQIINFFKNFSSRTRIVSGGKDATEEDKIIAAIFNKFSGITHEADFFEEFLMNSNEQNITNLNTKLTKNDDDTSKTAVSMLVLFYIFKNSKNPKILNLLTMDPTKHNSSKQLSSEYCNMLLEIRSDIINSLSEVVDKVRLGDSEHFYSAEALKESFKTKELLILKCFAIIYEVPVSLINAAEKLISNTEVEEEKMKIINTIFKYLPEIKNANLTEVQIKNAISTISLMDFLAEDIIILINENVQSVPEKIYKVLDNCTLPKDFLQNNTANNLKFRSAFKMFSKFDGLFEKDNEKLKIVIDLLKYLTENNIELDQRSFNFAIRALICYAGDLATFNIKKAYDFASSNEIPENNFENAIKIFLNPNFNSENENFYLQILKFKIDLSNSENRELCDEIVNKKMKALSEVNSPETISEISIGEENIQKIQTIQKELSKLINGNDSLKRKIFVSIEEISEIETLFKKQNKSHQSANLLGIVLKDDLDGIIEDSEDFANNNRDLEKSVQEAIDNNPGKTLTEFNNNKEKYDYQEINIDSGWGGTKKIYIRTNKDFSAEKGLWEEETTRKIIELNHEIEIEKNEPQNLNPLLPENERKFPPILANLSILSKQYKLLCMTIVNKKQIELGNEESVNQALKTVNTRENFITSCEIKISETKIDILATLEKIKTVGFILEANEINKILNDLDQIKKVDDAKKTLKDLEDCFKKIFQTMEEEIREILINYDKEVARIRTEFNQKKSIIDEIKTFNPNLIKHIEAIFQAKIENKVRIILYNKIISREKFDLPETIKALEQGVELENIEKHFKEMEKKKKRFIAKFEKEYGSTTKEVEPKSLNEIYAAQFVKKEYSEKVHEKLKWITLSGVPKTLASIGLGPGTEVYEHFGEIIKDKKMRHAEIPNLKRIFGLLNWASSDEEIYEQFERILYDENKDFCDLCSYLKFFSLTPKKPPPTIDPPISPKETPTEESSSEESSTEESSIEHESKSLEEIEEPEDLLKKPVEEFKTLTGSEKEREKEEETTNPTEEKKETEKKTEQTLNFAVLFVATAAITFALIIAALLTPPLFVPLLATGSVVGAGSVVTGGKTIYDKVTKKSEKTTEDDDSDNERTRDSFDDPSRSVQTTTWAEKTEKEAQRLLNK